MTYRELLLQAELKLDHNDITLGEFEQMIAPLNREVDVLDKLKAEITQMAKDKGSDYQLGMNFGLMKAVQVINKYIGEGSKEDV